MTNKSGVFLVVALATLSQTALASEAVPVASRPTLFDAPNPSVVASRISLTPASATSGAAMASSDCFISKQVAGQNAHGYAQAFSWQNWSAYVRTAAAATLCIKYARGYGGYYFASLTCSQNSARLTSDTTSLRAQNSWVIQATYTQVGCATSARWLWNRAVANNQCVNLTAQTVWAIEPANGTVRVYRNLVGDGYFRPASSC